MIVEKMREIDLVLLEGYLIKKQLLPLIILLLRNLLLRNDLSLASSKFLSVILIH
jgi:hypothetical protein